MLCGKAACTALAAHKQKRRKHVFPVLQKRRHRRLPFCREENRLHPRFPSRHEIGRRRAPVTNGRLSVKDVARFAIFGNNSEHGSGGCAVVPAGNIDTGRKEYAR